MKSKNLQKKLSLNKVTITDLKIDELKKVHGGGNKSIKMTECTCHTVCWTC